LGTNTIPTIICKGTSLEEVFKRFFFSTPRELTIVTWQIEIFSLPQISSIQSIQQQQPEKEFMSSLARSFPKP
jgi:hypothetical protein